MTSRILCRAASRGFPLGIAPGKGRTFDDIISVFVALDHNGQLHMFSHLRQPQGSWVGSMAPRTFSLNAAVSARVVIILRSVTRRRRERQSSETEEGADESAIRRKISLTSFTLSCPDQLRVRGHVPNHAGRLGDAPAGDDRHGLAAPMQGVRQIPGVGGGAADRGRKQSCGQAPLHGTLDSVIGLPRAARRRGSVS